MELAQDKIFKKLPEQEKINLIREVLAIGEEVSGWVEKEYNTNDPRKIAASIGVKVFGEDKGKKKISEYRRQRKEIVVYRNIHEKLAEEIQARELSENLLKYFVAHELFHHLEMSRIGEIYKGVKQRGGPGLYSFFA
jgi:chromatin segregation and condensation protein Rec8/ScpA/Scc1 (kleisin family)